MTQRVAAEGVAGEEADVDEHDDRAHADAEVALLRPSVKATPWASVLNQKGEERVPRQQKDKEDAPK